MGVWHPLHPHGDAPAMHEAARIRLRIRAQLRLHTALICRTRSSLIYEIIMMYINMLRATLMASDGIWNIC